MNYSPAIWLVWRMAALTANREQTLIEPQHFLSAVFSLATLPKGKQFDDAETKVELEEVVHCFDTLELQRPEMLRRLESRYKGQPDKMTSAKPAEKGQAISRSKTSREGFEIAATAAQKESIDPVRLRHLIGGLFTASQELHSVLGIEQTVAEKLAASMTSPHSEEAAPPIRPPLPSPAPEHTPTSGKIVVQELDATTVLDSEIDWNSVGMKFATVCELAWKSGTGGDVHVLLQSLIEKMLEFIPRATHGAILILDPITGDLDLKAHAPRGHVLPSRSSAQQALDEKKAFIWKRVKDLSKTQTIAQIESGVYAPIIADDRAFGVICLHTRSLTARLTQEDLFLAASVGHQIGLVMANRDLKTEVAQKVNVMERLMTNFSPQVRTHLIHLAQAGRLKLGGERSYVSILCADIRGFTLMAADMDTDDLLAMLNDYFAVMVNCVFRNEGTIDKFIGDALLAVFGSPAVNPRHTEQATKAAIAMQEATHLVSERRKSKGEKTCEIGIGVHTGEVVHGFVGSADRMEFTIIGDTVNMTARYCSGAGPSEIIVSPNIHERLWRTLEVEPVEITTKHEGNLNAYKLLSIRSS